ncbi:MAG: AAA family ATPase, partial [Planctomycetota bacterium]
MNDDDNDLLKYLEGLSTPEGGKKIKVPVDTWVPKEMENRGEENSKEIKRLRNSLATPDPNATPYIAESSSKDLNTLGAYYTDLLNEDEKQGLLFVGDRDFLQDRKAAAQSNFDKASIAVLEFVPGVAGKVIEGFGHVAGGMADVVSMPFTGGKMPGYIFDNSLVDFGKWVGEDFAKIMPQIKSIVAGDSEIHSYSGYSKESKLWNKLAYPEFWTKDFMDGAEFLASALVAGGGAGKVGGLLSTLGKGSKTAKIAEKARAAALAAGADAATASKVAASAVAQTKAGGRWAWGAATLYNTVSEAGVESGEMYKSIKEELDARDPYSKKRKINPDTGLEYTDQDIEDVALQRSYNVFRGNFFGLLLSNGIEMGAFLPAAFKTSRNKLYREVIQESTEKAGKIKKSARFGRGLLPGQTAPNTVIAAGKGFATGIATEALYEENFQNAISRVEGDLSKSYPSGDSMAWVNAFSENLKSFWKGIKGENLNPEEMEAAHSMMLGGILGGGFQTISGVKNHMAEKAKKEGIEKEWQAFQTQLDITDKYLIDNIGSIYKSFEKEVTEKDENGKERKVIKKSYLNDKGETELDYNKVEKLFFQSMYEKNLFDLNKSAIAHNDPYQADYNREFGLGTMVYNYLQSVDKGNDPELAKMILKHRIRESLVETADKKGTFSSEDAQALGISQDAKVLEDLVDAYADIWANIDESTRVSGEEMDFINKYKKVKFYNEIKKRALNSMLDRANNEENKKAIAELENLIEQEDAYYEKLLEDKDKFKEIYTSQDQAVSNMEDERDDIISKIAQENDLDKKKILVEEKNRLQYFIDEHKKIESSPTQMTEEQRFRADADMKSKDKFLFDLGTSYKAKRAIEEVNIEIHAEKEKLDALRREVSNQEEATEEQIKEIEAIEDQIQRRLQDGFGIVTNNKNHLTKESVAQFQALYDLYVEEESRLVSEIESLNVAFNTSQENQKKFEEAMGEEQKRASFNFYSFFAELSNNVFSFAYDVESPLFEFIMDNFEDPLSLTKEELLDAINRITPTDQEGNIAANDDPQMQRFIEWVNQSFESVGISPAQTYGEVFAGLKGLSDALDEKAVEQHQKAAAEEKEKQKAISLKLDNVDQKHTKFTRGLEKTVTAATDAVRKGVIRDDIRQKAKSSPEVLDRYMKREYAEIPIILVKGQMSLFKADEKSYDAEITPLVNLKNKLLLTKNVYETERKDMEKTKEFKGFMEELNQAIEDIDILIKAAKANATNIKIKELNKAKKNARVKLAAIGIQVDEFGEWEITNQLIYDQLTEMLEGISNTTGVNLFNSILQDAQGDIIDMGTSAEIVIELATKHKTLTSEEQRKKYLELLKGNVRNAQGLIQRVAAETKVLGLFPMDTYIASPERAFRSTLLRKFSNAIFSRPEFTKDNSSFNPIFTFDETRDLDELKAKIQNPLIKDTIGEDLIEETIALIEAHQNLLNAQAAIRYAETSNIFSETHKNETEALLEIANSENIKEKIVPTPEQVVTYREVVKALGLPISGRTTQALSRAFTYVMGPAGSGKSRAVLGWVAKSLGLKKEEMYAFSHETSSSKNIADSTGATQGTLDNFLDPNLDLSKFKLIVIDEIAFFNNKTIYDIEKRVEIINRQRATNDKLRVVLLGDPGQTRKESLSSLDQTSVLTNMTVIPPLTVTHRSHVSSINDMQKRFRRTSTEVKDGLTLVSNQDVSLPYNANNEVVGVQGGESKGSIINAIENNKLSGRDKVIVVASEEDKGFYTESSTIQNLMSKGGNNRPHLQVLTYEEVQGQTFPEVYVDIQTSGKNINGQVFSEQDSWLDYNTAMYTALSRASHYAFMIYPGIKNVTSDDIIADKKAGEQRIVDNFSEFARKIEKESEMLSKYIPTYGESSTVEINPNGTTETKKPKIDPEIVLDPEDDVEIEEDNFDPNDNPTVVVEDDVVEGEIEDEQETSSDVVGSTEDVDMVIDTEDYHDLRYPENSAARGDRGGTQASYPHSTIVPAGTVLINKDGTEIVVNESSPVIYAKYRDENGVEHIGVFGQIQKNNSFNPGNPQWKLLGIIGPEDETDNFYKANVTPHIDRVNKGGGVATFINGKLDNLSSAISYDPQTGKAITNNFSSAQYSPVLYAAEVQYARSLGFKWNLKDNPITNFVSHIMDRVRVGFFGGTMPQRKPSFTVKIFTKTDIKNNDNLKSENRNGHRIRPGIPYFIIENPQGDRTKSVVRDLMFRLTPRKLKQSDFNSDTGGKFAPINKLMEVLSILEKGPNMADKGLGAVDPLTGIAHTNELFKKMARARDENGELGFSENSDGKVIFDRRIYTWEQYQEDIEKDYIELEGAKGHFTEAQFNYIYEVAQELIPLVYGFTTKRKSVVLKSQPEIDAYQKKLDENPKTAGYKLIERENTENSYWIWSNPIGPNEQKTPNYYKEYEKERAFSANKGEAQKLLNELMAGNTKFPLSVEVRVRKPKGGFKVFRTAKNILATASHNGYRGELEQIVIDYIKEEYGEDEVSKHFAMLKSDPLHVLEDRVRGIFNKQDANKTVEEIKAEFKVDPITNESLQNMFGDSAFDNNGEHKGTTLSGHLAMPLDMNEINELGEKLNSTSKKEREGAVAELESIMGTKLESIDGARIIVKKSGIAAILPTVNRVIPNDQQIEDIADDIFKNRITINDLANPNFFNSFNITPEIYDLIVTRVNELVAEHNSKLENEIEELEDNADQARHPDKIKEIADEMAIWLEANEIRLQLDPELVSSYLETYENGELEDLEEFIEAVKEIQIEDKNSNKNNEGDNNLSSEILLEFTDNEGLNYSISTLGTITVEGEYYESISDYLNTITPEELEDFTDT